MVTLTVYVEGGEDHPNMSTTAVDNNIGLREAFNKFFSSLLSNIDKVRIETWPSGGWPQARSKFLNVLDKNNVVLFVDMDDKFENLADKVEMRKARLAELELTDLSEQVFFMFRETEAWFFSQTETIMMFAESEGFIKKKPNEEIHDNLLIRTFHPEDIRDPSGKLNTIFRQHFEKERRSGQKPKPVSYHKGRHAPALLELLDAPALSPIFSDVKRFQEYLGTLNTTTQ